MSVSSPTELRATLIELVAGATETDEAKWEKLIGAVETLPILSHPRCNWRVKVGGHAADRAVVEKAIELLREASPYVSSGSGPGA